MLLTKKIPLFRVNRRNANGSLYNVFCEAAVLSDSARVEIFAQQGLAPTTVETIVTLMFQDAYMRHLGSAPDDDALL